MHRQKLAFVTRNPLLVAAFAFVAGVVVARLTWRPAGWMVAAILALVLIASAAPFLCKHSLRRWSAAAVACAFLACSALGILDFQLQQAAASRADTLAPYTTGLLYTVTGYVSRSGEVDASAEGYRQIVEIATEQIDRYGDVHRVHSGIRLTLYSDAPFPPVAYGTRVQSDLQLRAAQMFRNPGAFDYRAWLKSRGLTAVASLPYAKFQTVPGRGGSRLAHVRADARASVLTHLHRLALAAPGMSADDTAVLSGITFGEQSAIPRTTREDFQRTGLYHLLVVSGMNVAIIAIAIFWAVSKIARRLRFADAVATVATASFAVIYVALTDLGAPVTRALIMALVYLVARFIYRAASSLNAVGAAALAIAAWDPSAIFDASFQMTFLSVFAIVAIIAPVIEQRFSSYRHALHDLHSTSRDFALLGDASEASVVQFRIDMRMIALRLERLLRSRRASTFLLQTVVRCALLTVEALTLALLMQFVLALPMAIYFHRVTWTALAANSISVPLMQALMPLALLALLCTYGPLWIAKVPAFATAVALHALHALVTRLGALRLADARIAQPPLRSTALFILLLALSWMIVEGRARLRWWCSIAALSLAIAFSVMLAPARAESNAAALEITAIDVGQGDSLLVVTPDGKRLLIDAGGPAGMNISSGDAFDYGEQVVAPYLWQRGIDHLDCVAITHGHSDHMEGVAAIIRDFHPRELWIGTLPHSAMYEQIRQDALANGTTIRAYHDGDHISFGATSIDVLAPSAERRAVYAASNDDSLALYIRFGNATALLAGDAERATEALIAAHHPRAEFLKIDHHGSSTSTTPELLDAVQPRWSVISVGAHNRFGHPTPAVLERLAAAHVRTYRTDLDGATTFLLASDGSMTVKGSW